MADRYVVGVSATNREAAGVADGQTHDITLELDTVARTVDVPDDFAVVLVKEPDGQRAFDAL